MVESQPQLQVGDDAASHRCLALAAGRQVDLDPVFEDVGVDPHEDLSFGIQKHHVLVYDEETIARRQLGTRYNQPTRIGEGFLVGAEVLQLREGVRSEVVCPYFLQSEGQLLAYNDLGSAFNIVLVAVKETLELLETPHCNFVTYSIVLLH